MLIVRTGQNMPSRMRISDTLKCIPAWTGHGLGNDNKLSGDFCSRNGMEAGPRVGQLLEQLHEAQVTGQVETREAAIAYLKTQ